MLFLMLVCQDNAPVPASPDPLGSQVEQWVQEMDSTGARITGDALAPESQAEAVRIRDGQLQVTKGPFLHTEGALLGFDVLDCPDMAEAIKVAAAHPLAKQCVLEIRPVDAE